MKNFFKIGEISKLYGIGVDSIRYYEEIGIIKPQRSESGYRYYSIHDIWRLNVIRDLRSIGFTMEQIREYLDHHTVFVFNFYAGRRKRRDCKANTVSAKAAKKCRAQIA